MSAMVETTTDPCLAFVQGWEAAMAEASAIEEADGDDVRSQAFYTENVTPFADRANAGDVPAATTAEGAAAALRRVLAWEEMEEQDACLVRAALAFLEAERS